MQMKHIPEQCHIMCALMERYLKISLFISIGKQIEHVKENTSNRY